MANKHQQNRAKKQEKRRLKSKAKAKAYRIEKQGIGQMLKEPATPAQRKSVYDIIGSKDVKLMRREMQRRTGTLPEAPDEEGLDSVGLTGMDLLRAINDMITMSVKLHAGVAVYLKLSEVENRFFIEQNDRDKIDAYEQKLFEFCEDVHAVTELHRAGRQPTDYLEIVIHITDVMDELISVHRDAVLDVIKVRSEEIETWANEHRPADADNYTFMAMLHERRIQEITPLYQTNANKELVANLLSLHDDLTEEPDLGDDLNLVPADDDVGEDETVQAPNDPVTEAHQQ